LRVQRREAVDQPHPVLARNSFFGRLDFDQVFLDGTDVAVFAPAAEGALPRRKLSVRSIVSMRRIVPRR